MRAAAFGTAADVQTLLEKGADPNERNSFEATALLYAASDSPKVRLLLKGADVNAHSKRGRTPLMIAASCDGCSAIVKLLLSKGADPKAKDAASMTALDLAAQAGDAESVRLLLAAGADANAPSSAGLTPLMYAEMSCNLDIVKQLLANHASVNARNTNGGQVKFGPIQLIDLTPLHIAAPYCNAEMARTLVDAGADPNALDVRGMTPLMLSVASETQDAAVVRFLVVHGEADLTLKSKLGETALDWARKYNNKDVIAQLTGAGAWLPPTSTPVEYRREKPATPLAAVEQATTLLQKSAVEFFHQAGCVGCHHQPMALAAIAAARDAGVHVNETEARGLVQMIDSEWTGNQETFLEHFDPGGLTDGEGYSAWALSLNRYAPTPVTDVVAVHVAALQRIDGRWHVGDVSRAPLQESDIARTARSILVLKKYSPAGRRAEFDDDIRRARNFLANSITVTNDDAAMQIAGLTWAGDTQDNIRPLALKLIAAQHADGGWGQNPNLSSDAFATGETLWALRESGSLTPASPVYRRGVDYLLGTQHDDGSWHVRSRAPKFQPYFESGFPHGHDQWVSAAATSWAVLALAPAISKETKLQ
jgi:ankyrin repeat protein